MSEPEPHILTLQACRVDLRTGQLSAGREGTLTSRELQLLARLAQQPGVPISRAELFALFGYAPSARSRAVDKTMYALRHKVERDRRAPDHLVTVHGLGYVFHGLASAEIAPAPTVPDGDMRCVGRQRERSRLERHLRSGVDLVLLVGAGGMGKTTLARAFVEDVADRFDEAHLVDLGPADTADLASCTDESTTSGARSSTATLSSVVAKASVQRPRQRS